MDNESLAAFNHRSATDPVYINKEGKIFNTNDADIFYAFNLSRNDVISLVFYIVCFIFFLTVWLIQLFLLRSLYKHFFFYTTQTYLLNLLWLGFSIVNILTKSQRWDCFWQVMRVLHILVYTMSFSITFAYWVFLSWSQIPNLNNACSSYGWCLFYAIASHGLVCLPSWIVLLTMLTEINIYDVIWPLGYLFIYLIFLLWPLTIHYEILYDPITFKNGLTFACILLWVVTILAVFFLGYYLSQCTKKRILKGWEAKRGDR